MPLVQGGYLGSTWPESAFKKNVGVDPVKIEALPTPRESHGTKILGYIFFSCHPLLMFFYWFCWLIWQKVKKNLKKGSFSAHFLTFCYLLQRKRFSLLFTFFCKITPQNLSNNIYRGWRKKNFEPKILVPWDSPGVSGASILAGSTPTICWKADSSHVEPKWPPCTSGIRDSRQKT